MMSRLGPATGQTGEHKAVETPGSNRWIVAWCGLDSDLKAGVWDWAYRNGACLLEGHYCLALS